MKHWSRVTALLYTSMCKTQLKIYNEIIPRDLKLHIVLITEISVMKRKNINPR